MILITGASGNVGREVLKQISQAGHKVRAAYQSSQKVAEAPAGVETVIVDFNRPDTLRAALNGINCIFWSGRSRQIWSSSKARRPRRSNVAGVEWTFLRPNGFMQNMVIYNSATVRVQNTFYGSSAGGKVSQIDIRDTGAAAVRVLTEDGHVGKTYTLTGPAALSNAEAAAILSSVLGREIRYVNLPPDQMKQALLGAGTPEWNANGIIDLEALYREGGASTVSPDIERLLGRKPIAYEQFARDYASNF
ncbi:MAG TPA: NAD(P)H-binding protein [Bryobacteraceae bacterium]|jgi:uncharacterized protein YbjT (DUF2867 family)